ncbi:COX15-CtaA-domain-containing protein [Ramaria rubella]|nr:COX15-CtaA-domain-containing protein [Ramaria rubella]
MASECLWRSVDLWRRLHHTIGMASWRHAQSLFHRVLKKNTPPLQARGLTQSSFFPAVRFPLHAPRRHASLWTPRRTPTEVLKSSLRSPGYFSSNSASLSHALPPLSPPSVGYWLLCSSALVFGIVVVGGVTRLTESGLSITEWKPVSGIFPPISPSDWAVEFEKYRVTPEFKLLNHQITIEEFKRIFYMEYSHRILGRLIGVAFVLPYVYFLASKRLTPTLPTKLGALAGLIGLQGFLGWYMVKSGLEESIMDTPGAVPRVSQYRLAAHLGAAVALYAGMLGIGISVLRDWKFAKHGLWNGIHVDQWDKLLKDPQLQRFAGRAWVLVGLVFLTALSGAFVAGLDAGLLYNEFPMMGGRLAPPKEELFSPAYAKRADGADLWWRNMLENPTTVQFDHRLLATTTYFGTTVLFLSSMRPSLRAALPPITRKLIAGAFAAANVQVLLGISTLLYLVPVPLAAAHQAGSVALLTFMIALVTSLRRPHAVARLWRESKRVGTSHR